MPDIRLRVTITVITVALAILHAFNRTITIDSTTIILCVVASLPWLQPLLKSIELLGVKFELQELKATVKQQTRNLELIEESAILPGSASRRDTTSESRGSRHAKAVTETGEWADDPNKGKFGGDAKRAGRVLEAEISPAGNKTSAACEVILTVRSTDPERPLTGVVTFHLHPTFGRWEKYNVDVKAGIARDEIVSWGAFTVGAEADNGRTRLELDLARVPGGTSRFYRS